jgi:hypothetical protein
MLPTNHHLERTVYGFIRHPETAEVVAWAADGYVFDIESRKTKMFALRGATLSSLAGECLNIHFANVNGGNAKIGASKDETEAFARFEKLMKAD